MVPIRPDRIQDVLRLEDGESVVLEDDGEEVVVRPEDEPRLLIERAPECSHWEWMSDGDRCRPLNVPLGHARVERDELHLDAYEGSFWHKAPKIESMTLRADDIRSITLLYTPPDRVHFGLGLMAMGPSRFVGYELLVFPEPWLGLEAGFSAVPHAGVFLWSGLRIRPVDWGDLRPFIGAFVNYGVYSTVSDPDFEDDAPEPLRHRELAYGPRLGLDIRLSRSFMFTLEADVLRVDDAGGEVRSEAAGTWSATGGLAISVIF